MLYKKTRGWLFLKKKHVLQLGGFDKVEVLRMNHLGVSTNSGKTPKMDGENNGKPYEQMDDLGGNTPIFGNTHYLSTVVPDFALLWMFDG